MAETTVFALGCFWHPEEYYSNLEGVEETKVGYSGGSKKNPTYHDLGDHTESVKIVFNPDVISYKELLKVFWNLHDPTQKGITQYKSIIFYNNEEQKKEAEESMKKEQENTGKPIVTEIKPLKEFYEAEEYHQKYLRKNKGGVC